MIGSGIFLKLSVWFSAVQTRLKFMNIQMSLLAAKSLKQLLETKVKKLFTGVGLTAMYISSCVCIFFVW